MLQQMPKLEDTLSKVQTKFNIASFNAMQKEAFQVIPKSKDTLLLSPTGSGKTLAFLLPIMNQLDLTICRTQVLIISPTRELAIQITNVSKDLGLGFNILCCYGGHSPKEEKKSLQSDPEMIIGTPGRILDHLDRENIDTTSIKFLILDEFDKTLEMGFHSQMESIIKHFRFKPQYILTSATEGLEIPDFVPLEELISINHLSNTIIDGLKISKVWSPSKDKLDTLFLLLNDIGNQSTIVFCNYRQSVQRIHEHLMNKNIFCDFLHGGLDQIERENVLSKFRNGTTKLLISTDLAGRGLDIPEVQNIVHYHLPMNEETFIHRNGRTARMFADGNAYVILSNDDATPDYVNAISNKYTVSNTINEIQASEWISICISKGKKDKINKIDIVGFMYKIGKLEKEDLGLIEIKDNYSIIGINATKAKDLITKTNNQKIKGKKTLVKLL